MNDTDTVVPGNSLHKITGHLKTTTRALVLANKIENVNLIFWGQEILVP